MLKKEMEEAATKEVLQEQQRKTAARRSNNEDQVNADCARYLQEQGALVGILKR